jgi:hypothetical protein
MTDRPIIFSGPMVRALLDGRKTQTRRLATSPLRRCEAGDRLYVRESWRVSPEAAEGWHPDAMRGWIDFQAGESIEAVAPSFAAVEAAAFTKHDDRDWDFLPSRYRPSIHMPRWASRLTLVVEDVRFQRLRDISEGDARAEGIVEHPSYFLAHGAPVQLAGVSAYGAFYCLWNSLHTKNGERWEDNPEIVALTFRVISSNIDRIAA